MPLPLSIKAMPEDVLCILKAKAAGAETSRLLAIKEITTSAETADFSSPNQTTRTLREDHDR